MPLTQGLCAAGPPCLECSSLAYMCGWRPHWTYSGPCSKSFRQAVLPRLPSLEALPLPLHSALLHRVCLQSPVTTQRKVRACCLLPPTRFRASPTFIHLNSWEFICASGDGDSSLICTIQSPVHWGTNSSFIQQILTNSYQVPGPVRSTRAE